MFQNMNLVGRIFGFLAIVVVLALAPSISSANAVVAGDNLTNLIGMTIMVQFASPLIIIGLLVLGGAFAWGKAKFGSMSDMWEVIGSAVVAIVSLTFMDSIIDYVQALIGDGVLKPVETGFALILYGIIPLAIYIVIIEQVGRKGYTAIRGGRKKGKRSAYANY